MRLLKLLACLCVVLGVGGLGSASAAQRPQDAYLRALLRSVPDSQILSAKLIRAPKSYRVPGKEWLFFKIRDAQGARGIWQAALVTGG